MSKTKWTTANIPDLTGKVIIVTGGNSGLGYESVKAFAEEGAEYYGPDGMGEMKGYPVLVKSNKASHNQEDAIKLWETSEELTGIIYSFK